MGFIPSALAKSSSIVTSRSEDQFIETRIITKITPRYIHHKSFELTVKISPNKNAWISILILLREITMIPMERARWAKTPKRVSVDKILFCWSHRKSIPKNKHTTIIPKLIPVPSKIPNPTPNNELCAIDSP